MKVLNSELTQAQQQQLIKKITPFVVGVAATPINDIKLDGLLISGHYNQVGETFTVTSVTNTEEKQAETDYPEILTQAIATGTVTKNEKSNWFKLNGRSYNGVNAIVTALEKL